MNKKTVQILLSTLHISVFCIGAVVLCHNTTAHSAVPAGTDNFAPVTELASDEETQTLPELLAENEPESETVTETESESTTELPETEPDAVPVYAFQYTRGIHNLNIRKGPSLDAEIIGKIPPSGTGTVIEFTNDAWALVQYNGITGYCSREWILEWVILG